MARPNNLSVEEEEYQRVKRYAIGKGKRYNLTKIRLSDRMVVVFNPEQLDRLINELREEGFELELKGHIAYANELGGMNSSRLHEMRFGSAPPKKDRDRAPGVDWARG